VSRRDKLGFPNPFVREGKGIRERRMGEGPAFVSRWFQHFIIRTLGAVVSVVCFYDYLTVLVVPRKKL
jgi:hypothetical protein